MNEGDPIGEVLAEVFDSSFASFEFVVQPRTVCDWSVLAIGNLNRYAVVSDIPSCKGFLLSPYPLSIKQRHSVQATVFCLYHVCNGNEPGSL